MWETGCEVVERKSCKQAQTGTCFRGASGYHTGSAKTFAEELEMVLVPVLPPFNVTNLLCNALLIAVKSNTLNVQSGSARAARETAATAVAAAAAIKAAALARIRR